MTAQETILAEQRKRVTARRWSDSGEYQDYLAEYTANFIHEPNDEIKAEYNQGAGSEIPTEYDSAKQRGYRLNRGKVVPAKMQAIHSSSALVCNAFAYWADQQDRVPLQQALGCADVITDMAFEAKKPTGLGGIPPHLDVVFTCNGRVHAVESKFSEQYQEKKKIVMGSKSYDPTLWATFGLTKCAELVKDINTGKMDGIFRYLSANQLLKHILGLWNTDGAGFELIYLWYEVPGTSDSDRHKAEVEIFKGRIGNEVNFRSITYQQLFAAIKAQCGGRHQDYFDRFSRRYL